MTLSLLDDKRPVEHISYDDGTSATVGIKGITKIEPYADHGELWVAIYQGFKLTARVPARKLTIVHGDLSGNPN